MFKKTSKEERIKYKKYKQMMKRNKANILKVAKHAAAIPHDFYFGLDMFVAHLKFMRDYYELNYNVYGCEEKDHNRFEKINEAIKEFELGYENTVDFANLFFEEKVIGEDMKIADFSKPLNGDSCMEAMEKYNQKILSHRQRFHEILLMEMGYWWD